MADLSSSTATTRLNETLGLLHFAFRAVVEEPDRILEARGLGRVHHRILFFLGRNGALAVGDLRGILGVSKQALHRPLQELRERHLVTVAERPSDRRVRLLMLTRRGSALEARLSGMQRRQFAAAFASAGPRARAGWREVMQALAPGDPFGRDRLPRR